MIFFDFLVLNDSNLHLPLKGAIVIDTLQFCGHFLVLKLYGLGYPYTMVHLTLFGHFGVQIM